MPRRNCLISAPTSYKKATVLRLVGGANLVLACLGVFALAWTLLKVLPVEQHQELPGFSLAMVLLSVIYGACMLVLAGTGFFFVRGNAGPWHAFIGLILFETICMIAAGMDWSAIAPAISAADRALTGAVLLPQFIALHPIWAPLAVLWARRDS